jgi:parallel beta-helix repeat protein
LTIRAKVLFLYIMLVVGSSAGIGSAHGANLTTHAPIVITGDGGFTAANGVTGGSGIRSDPYTIVGWDINSTTSPATFQMGISVSDTRAYFVVSGVNVYGKTGVAVSLQNVTNGRIQSSILSNSSGGVNIFSSSNITVSNNTIEFDQSGVTLAYARNITLQGNIFTSDGIYVSPSQTDAPAWNSYTITQDNLVNGRPIRFVNNCSQVTLNGDLVGQLILANCTRVIVRNLTVTNTASSIQLANVSDFLIENSTLSSNRWEGITASGVTNGTITNVTASNNGNFGLDMSSLTNVTLSNGNFSSNGYVGVELVGAKNVTFSSGVFSHNKWWGLLLASTQNLHVFHNDFIENAAGCPLFCSSGISSQIRYETTPLGSDTWDDGYPSGGNYWSDYVGVDVCNGAFQDKCNRCGVSFQEPCADGIGGSPQMVTRYQTVNPTDRYPLMKPSHPDTTPPSWPSSPFLAPAINSAFVGPTWVSLYWTQATDDVKVTAYRLYANNALIATVPAGQPYHNATSLTPGTTYNFQVAAVDEDGNVGSPLSISIKTPPVQPSASGIPSWYLFPIGFGATAAVVATALFAKRHYHKEEGRMDPPVSHPPQPRNTRPDSP